MDFWKKAYRFYNTHQVMFVTYVTFAIIGGFLVMLVAGSSGSFPLFMFALIGVTVIITTILVCIFTIGKREATRAQSNFTVKTERNNTNTLFVLRREPANAEILSLERYVETYSQYHPATATITAVTVGGVTTGGVDIKEAHYSTKAGRRTDRYHLNIRLPVNKYAEKTYPVFRIELTNEDMEIARNKPEIGKFIENGCLVLRHKTSSAEDIKMLKTLSNARDINAGLNMVVKDMTETMLSYSEAKNVLDFLCGKSEPITSKESIFSSNGNTALENGWVCSNCGKHHYEYETSCSCGKSRLDA